jgi:hypothetical protein
MPFHLLLAVTLWATASGAAGAAASNLISNVEVKDEAGSLRVVIRGSQPASFTTFSMVDPPRFVIDVAGAAFKGVPRDIAVKDGTIQVIKNLAFQGESGAVARIMLAFQGEVDPPGVTAAGNSLVVTVAKRQGEVAAAAPPAQDGPPASPSLTSGAAPPRPPTQSATASPGPPAVVAPAAVPEPPAVVAEPARSVEPPAVAAEPEHAAAEAASAHDLGAEPAPLPHPRKRHAASARERPLRLQELGFRQLDASSRVYVRVSAAPRFRIVEAGEKRIRVELPDTRVARPNDARFLDTSFFPSAVAMVVPRREGSSTVLEITLREKVQYQQRVEGDTLSIDFERPGASPRAPAAIDAEKAPAPGE